MSRTATRATAALLCGVVLVALGLAIIGMPDDATAPESMNVEVDFDTFIPGVTQTRSSAVDVPVPSKVAEARVDTTGSGASIDATLSICQLDRCAPLVVGAELDPGPYTLTVAATMNQSVEPGSTVELFGRIRIIETHQSAAIDPTLLIAAAGIGLVTISTGALLVGRHRTVAP
jgi:hypothetical protein